jgi:hypothetical protein
MEDKKILYIPSGKNYKKILAGLITEHQKNL